MAVLQNQSTGARALVRPRHMVGRSQTHSHLLVPDTDVSRQHALILWQDQSWFLRDLSSNGVWIGDKRVNPAQSVELSAGDKIRFGRHPHNTWVFVDASAPQSVLIAISEDAPDLVLDDYNAFSNGATPITITKERPGQWVLLRDGVRSELQDGEQIEIDGALWQANLVSDGTGIRSTERVPLVDMAGMKLRFQVSRDEEHVTLDALLEDGQRISFGERTHHYLLLTLARQRSQDAAQGFDEASQGWLDMDRLCDMLGMDAAHVNIQIHRARKQLRDLLVSRDLKDDFVERRSGGVRLRAQACEIYRGSDLETALPPHPAMVQVSG